MWTRLQTYGRYSTVHGLKYVFMDQFGLLERCLWLCIILVFFGYCVNYAVFSFHIYMNDPTSVSINNVNIPFGSMYFPALTVCPSSNIRNRTAAILDLKRFLNGTEVEYDALDSIVSLMEQMKHPNFNKLAPHLEKSSPYLRLFDKLDVSEFMNQNKPLCSDIFTSCRYHGVYDNCCNLFELQETELGFCYSFNSITQPAKKKCLKKLAIPQFGINSPNKKKCGVYMLNNMGGVNGLTVTFTSDLKRIDAIKGVYVLVHPPYDFPETGRLIQLKLRDGAKLDILTAAEIWTPDYDFKKLSLQYRNCIHKHDSFNSLDGVYTFNACHIKCRLDFIFSRCGCSPYYFSDGPKPVCKLSLYWCLQLISRKEALGKCPSCLPSCKRSLYNLLVRRSFTTPGNLTWTHHKDSSAYMMLSFSYLGSISYSKSFVSPTIPFGTIGGVVNLLLGCSIISFIEIFYFFTKSFLEEQHSRIKRMYRKKKKYPPLQPFIM